MARGAFTRSPSGFDSPLHQLGRGLSHPFRHQGRGFLVSSLYLETTPAFCMWAHTGIGSSGRHPSLDQGGTPKLSRFYHQSVCSA